MLENKNIMAFYSVSQQNLKYKKKLKKIKRTVENYVFENAALCDQVAQIQENIIQVKEQRRQLLKKLLELDNDLLTEETKSASVYPFVDDCGVVVNVATKRPYKKRVNTEGGKMKKSTTTTAASAAAAIASSTDSNSMKSINDSQSAGSTPTSLPLSQGTTFPMNLGDLLSIHKLGEILPDRPNYHTEHCIYPAGFVSTRIYGHIKDPERKCVYTCRVQNDGDFPRFEIIPDSDIDFVIAGPTPDLCHAALIQAISKNKELRNVEIRSQGEWFFGLAHPMVVNLLQSSPLLSKCSKFKGFKVDMHMGNDPSISYDHLQRLISRSSYRTLEEVKDEPPDELFEQI